MVGRFVLHLSQKMKEHLTCFPAKIGLNGQGEVVGCGDTGETDRVTRNLTTVTCHTQPHNSHTSHAGLDVDSCFFWDQHQAIAFDGGR